MLESITINPSTPAKISIIWLHGLGADGNDFVPIAQQLHTFTSLPIRFIFPHAPLRAVTLNGGYVMRAWYDIFGLNLNTREDRLGLQKSAQNIEALIENEIASGLSSKQIALAGFSQGGAMALYTALRYTQPLAGIIALSTYLPMRETLIQEANHTNQSIPIFMAHGQQDNVIPFHWAELSHDSLKQHGYKVNWHNYPIGHSVSTEEVSDIIRWLTTNVAALNEPIAEKSLLE